MEPATAGVCACDAIEMTAWQLRKEDLEFNETRQRNRRIISRCLDSSLGAMRRRSDVGRCAECGSLPRSVVSRQCLSRWAANNPGPSCAPTMTLEVEKSPIMTSLRQGRLSVLDSRLRVVQKTCSIPTARSMVAWRTPDGLGFQASELLHKSIYCWTDKAV